MLIPLREYNFETLKTHFLIPELNSLSLPILILSGSFYKVANHWTGSFCENFNSIPGCPPNFVKDRQSHFPGRDIMMITMQL